MTRLFDRFPPSLVDMARIKPLKTDRLSDILTAMSVSTRRFLREFPTFRERAEQGDIVVIESRKGVKFVFRRIGEAPRPRRVESALPKRITDRWQVDKPATAPDEWEMNR